MRSPRHWLKKQYGEWRIHARREELEREMSEGLGKPVTLKPFGDGGNDSIYLARSSGEKLAVVRLHNPFKKDFFRMKGLRPRKPGAGKDPMKALNREWEAYRALAESGVTPRPVWRTDDATAVSHLPGIRMNAFLRSLPAESWLGPVSAAFRSLARIHELKRPHHDAKAANIIFDDSAGNAYFIDLDRLTAKNQPLAYQQTFDWLKLLASFLQIAPRGLRDDGAFWFEALDPHVPAALREVNVVPMLADRTLRHLTRSRRVREALAPVFRFLASPNPPQKRSSEPEEGHH